MTAILNVAAYRFVAIDDAPALAERLRVRAEAAALKGTVLLAAEGINLGLAGAACAVRGFLDALRRDPRFADLAAHESWSEQPPFERLRVKVKREIIRIDRPALRPALRRAPALAPDVLERWLDAGRDDAGRPLALLDTRNAFEVDRGALRGAVDWRLARFGDFPAALAARADELAGKTVVAYCTGGIRCEKAALLVQAAGVGAVWQLEGGILGYLRHTDARHWRGDCVVFDDRGALDARLLPAA